MCEWPPGEPSDWFDAAEELGPPFPAFPCRVVRGQYGTEPVGIVRAVNLATGEVIRYPGDPLKRMVPEIGPDGRLVTIRETIADELWIDLFPERPRHDARRTARP